MQVTRDNVPIIYHDWIVAETGFDLTVPQLTAKQFLSLKSSSLFQSLGRLNRSLTMPISAEQQQTLRSLRLGNQKEKELAAKPNNKDRTNDTELQRKPKDYGMIQAPLTTLKEVLKVSIKVL